MVVQISNANWGIRSITDAEGDFSIQAYGPDVQLKIGVDADSDDVLDFSPIGPEVFWVNDITGDVTGLTIDLISF